MPHHITAFKAARVAAAGLAGFVIAFVAMGVLSIVTGA